MALPSIQGIEDPRPSVLDPCVLVIFGGSGDLAKHKLIPSLFHLANEGVLPRQFAVVGVAHTPMSDEEYRAKLGIDFKEHMGGAFDADSWSRFAQQLYYAAGDFSDPATYQKLQALLKKIEQQQQTAGNRLFYLATDPKYFNGIVEHLGTARCTVEEDRHWRRVVIEKPFGHDLNSARRLNQTLRAVLRERQIYRIDHYLGKETVQNILIFRFANGIFEPIWNRRYIDHIQITVAESAGVEGRGRYYDAAGALRDMVPNHIIQLLTFIAMEPPTSFEADALRDEQAKVLRSIPPPSPEEVLKRCVRGQYGRGTLKGAAIPAYRSEPQIAPDSPTETYVALKLSIDNWRWADVPFYLRTGKRLPFRVTEIAIQFKRPPFILFRKTPIEHLIHNWLVLRIQPNEGIALRFNAKIPGASLRVGSVDMDFHYADYFGCTLSTGYERLLYDCMAGDATLFRRADDVEAGWELIMPILDVWSALPPRLFPNYAAGTWGPIEADQLLRRDERHWREIQDEAQRDPCR
jgi:glucose-6-phosphate 1-dehydrogenase